MSDNNLECSEVLCVPFGSKTGVARIIITSGLFAASERFDKDFSQINIKCLGDLEIILTREKFLGEKESSVFFTLLKAFDANRTEWAGQKSDFATIDIPVDAAIDFSRAFTNKNRARDVDRFAEACERLTGVTIKLRYKGKPHGAIKLVGSAVLSRDKQKIRISFYREFILDCLRKNYKEDFGLGKGQKRRRNLIINVDNVLKIKGIGRIFYLNMMAHHSRTKGFPSPIYYPSLVENAGWDINSKNTRSRVAKVLKDIAAVVDDVPEYKVDWHLNRKTLKKELAIIKKEQPERKK